jgi:hypothetical protein
LRILAQQALQAHDVSPFREGDQGRRPVVIVTVPGAGGVAAGAEQQQEGRGNL